MTTPKEKPVRAVDFIRRNLQPTGKQSSNVRPRPNK